jgi:hypothetical protein
MEGSSITFTYLARVFRTGTDNVEAWIEALDYVQTVFLELTLRSPGSRFLFVTFFFKLKVLCEVYERTTERTFDDRLLTSKSDLRQSV